jgi:DNA-binding CsgD family transcriptional regulator
VRAGDEFAAAAARAVRAGVAVLDREGRIRWVNDAWERASAATPILAGAIVGTDLVERSRSLRDPIGEIVASALESVVRRGLPYFELEYPGGAAGAVRLSIAAERQHGGAVVMCADPATAVAAQPVVRRIDPTQLAERLTPRERDVLERLAEGHDNRTIAKQLGVEYSTVRGYVRSLIEKLGARSRVDVVGIAYRTGLVRLSEVEG